MLYFDIKLNGTYLAEGTYYNSSSRETIERLKRAVQYYKKHEEKKDLLYAVKLLETSGFVLGERELEKMRVYAPNAVFRAKKDKCGKISFYFATMHLETRNLYDSFITFDIGTEKIEFDSFVVYTKQPSKMLVQASIDVDFDDLAFDDLDKIEEAIQQDEDCFNSYLFKDKKGKSVRFLRGPNE